MERNYPEIIISNEGVTWLDKGQMWMYRNNLEKCDQISKMVNLSIL